MGKLSLTVNGARRELEVDDDMPLVWILRDSLGLTGTKFEQQIEGGIIWGISSALGGQITFKNGAAQQSTFADFAVARMKDAPAIEVHLVGRDGTRPFGIGEPPVPPSVPAIVNAIFAATGKRIRKLPITSEMLRSTAVSAVRPTGVPPVVSDSAGETPAFRTAETAVLLSA